MKLIEKLRESTKNQHSKLDQIPEMKRLTSESVEESDYRDYLFAFLTIYKSIEADIYNYSSQFIEEIASNQRLAQIENDLQAFHVQNRRPENTKGLELEGKEHLGALYVMEGSRLGGNLIAKHLSNQLNIKNDKLAFLISRPAVKWSQIISFLNEQPEANHVEIIKGAQKVFDYFYDRLSEFYKEIE